MRESRVYSRELTVKRSPRGTMCFVFLTFNFQLLTLNCFPSFRFLDHGLFAHDDDHAALRDVIPLAIGFEIVSDFGALGDGDVTVDDGVADAGVASDVHMVEQD